MAQALHDIPEGGPPPEASGLPGTEAATAESVAYHALQEFLKHFVECNLCRLKCAELCREGKRLHRVARKAQLLAEGDDQARR